MDKATHTPTIEEYLEAIYILQNEGLPIIGARLAERLRVSPPTVTATLKRMRRDGLIEQEERKPIQLTPHGREMADQLIRRHRLSERWLTDVLGMEWYKAHHEACRLEHCLSQEVEERLAASLGHPETCPHGNPIPGLIGPGGLVDAAPLSGAPLQRPLRIERVAERIEEDIELLRFLQQKDLRPGTRLTLLEVGPHGSPFTLLTAGGVVSVDANVASILLVSQQG